MLRQIPWDAIRLATIGTSVAYVVSRWTHGNANTLWYLNGKYAGQALGSVR